MTKYDVIIVGGGPAGLNAALVLGRCRYKVLLFTSNEHRNAPSSAMHGFLSRDGMHPMELLRIGREQLKPYGVELREALVASAECSDHGFSLTTSAGNIFTSRKLLLATGIIDNLPCFEGFYQFYGASAFHCPYCDGWEQRDKRIIAYATGKEATEFAFNLRNYSEEIVLCTDGEAELSAEQRERLAKYAIKISETPLVRVEGRDRQLERAVFSDGKIIECDALFFHLGQKQRSTLAAQLGCEVSNEEGVQAGNRCETNVPGLYIAGDATRDVQQVIVAAAEGAMAAFAINMALRDENYS